MDDFIKYIIWIVIIISFLSSFFRKKQPQKPAPPDEDYDDRSNSTINRQSANTVDKEEYDILKEIESMFKTDTSQPTKVEKTGGWQGAPPTKSEHVSYENTRNPGEYTSYERSKNSPEGFKAGAKAYNENKVTPSEHTQEDWIKKRDTKRRTAQVDASVSKQAEAFEKFLENRDAKKVSFAAEINKRLKHPSSLREYYIMAEILNKPKALRKR